LPESIHPDSAVEAARGRGLISDLGQQAKSAPDRACTETFGAVDFVLCQAQTSVF
jgi:hypothetical protein